MDQCYWFAVDHCRTGIWFSLAYFAIAFLIFILGKASGSVMASLQDNL